MTNEKATKKQLYGVRKGNISILPIHLGKSKKPRLVVQDGNIIVQYAIFNNDDAAEKFFEILCDFMGLEEKNDTTRSD